jgi:hypothetical protein
VETVDFFQKISHCPFPHPNIRQLRLPRNLSEHSHIHNMLAHYVRWETQTLALERIAAIFKGATRRKTKINMPPTKKEDTNAPPRVQPRVSPPRVPNTTAQNMSPHHNKHSDSIPNSHRRLNIPLICVVTTQTPHAMVRRSATQQYNLSQDLMVEALNRAKHCFPISPHTQKQKTKTAWPTTISSSCRKWQML